MSETEVPSKRGLKWDGTITAGNLLTAVAMLMAMLVWGLRLESKVEFGDSRIIRLEVSRDRDDRDTVTMREVVSRLQANQESWVREVANLRTSIDAAIGRRP